MNDGKPCGGSPVEVQQCLETECPGKGKKENYQNSHKTNPLYLASALFVYGGRIAGGLNTFGAEVVDLSGKRSLCSKPPSHPKKLNGMFGTFHYGQVMICGGYLEEYNIYSDECYVYEGKTRQDCALPSHFLF